MALGAAPAMRLSLHGRLPHPECRANAHRAALALPLRFCTAPRAGAGLDLLPDIKHGADLGQGIEPGRGRQPARAARLDQRHAERGFELAQLVMEPLRLDAERLGGAAGVAMLHQRDEDTQGEKGDAPVDESVSHAQVMAGGRCRARALPRVPGGSKWIDRSGVARGR
ncbi:hypothetical protein CBM2633_B10764 [Cupriavidus taiwanensis]|nr:hypothetical protein CBM2633_B10764 [Cupriavidus taiwanensis]